MARVSRDSEAGAWLDLVVDPTLPGRPQTALIGVLPGEGIGPEVVDAALLVLRSVEDAGGRPVQIEVGGAIGRTAEDVFGAALTDDVTEFCEDVLGRGGAILNGAGGGRYVYDLRRRLDLFLKITPVQARNGLAGASPLRHELLEGVDLLVLRENVGGAYQGVAQDASGADGEVVVRHSFSYSERDVRRFLDAAARIAGARAGELAVVVKEGGLAELSALWRRCAHEAAELYGVRCRLVDIDLMAYELVSRPQSFDVVAASNLAGDVLADLAAVLTGSRSLSFSGNFTPQGDGVYQTNHGAAYDIAGTGRANPAGQILSLAMLLRESLKLDEEAHAIEEGVRRTWQAGLRTPDLGGRATTRELAESIATAAAGAL
jgi:3-isopropylmalate dehydrogenase